MSEPDGEVAFLDASAFVKLFVAEPESVVLREELLGWPLTASSALLNCEGRRACERRQPGSWGIVRRELSRIAMVPVDLDVLQSAGRLTPLGLRSLDAIYIASAIAAGRAVGTFITYDARMCEAALAHGLPVASPGLN